MNSQAAQQGLLILGSGGHAKVVAEAALAAGLPILGFLDDAPERKGLQVVGLPVLGDFSLLNSLLEGRYATGLVCAIGANATRQRIVEQINAQFGVPVDGMGRGLWQSVIHPAATVSPSAQIAAGCMVLARTVINAEATIGAHCIVNTGAIIEHDCKLAAYVHTAPASTLTGNVKVEIGAFVGAGSTILPSVEIGAWTTVGAGAVVTRDLPARVTAIGIPARWDG